MHKVELRKRGTGPLYFNAYLTNFTLEDFITHAGLEIKVARNYFKLVRSDETTNVAGSRGQVVGQRTEHYRRVELTNFGEVKSGDLLEIELTIDSKNDYEHLVFEDPKAAGVEPFDVQSGYNASGLAGLRRAARRKGDALPADAAPRQAQPSLSHAGRNSRQVQRLADRRLRHVRPGTQGQFGRNEALDRRLRADWGGSAARSTKSERRRKHE